MVAIHKIIVPGAIGAPKDKTKTMNNNIAISLPVKVTPQILAKNKLTIEKTAKTLNYSISHLSHSIKKYLNCNFNTYVNIVRLNVFIKTIKHDPYTSKTSAILKFA